MPKTDDNDKEMEYSTFTHVLYFTPKSAEKHINWRANKQWNISFVNGNGDGEADGDGDGDGDGLGLGNGDGDGDVDVDEEK